MTSLRDHDSYRWGSTTHFPLVITRPCSGHDFRLVFSFDRSCGSRKHWQNPRFSQSDHMLASCGKFTAVILRRCECCLQCRTQLRRCSAVLLSMHRLQDLPLHLTSHTRSQSWPSRFCDILNHHMTVPRNEKPHLHFVGERMANNTYSIKQRYHASDPPLPRPNLCFPRVPPPPILFN